MRLAVCVKETFAGLSVNVGAFGATAVRFRVSEAVALPAVTVTAAWYEPIPRLDGLTVSDSVCDPVPDEGVTVSHGADETAVKANVPGVVVK